MSDIYEWVGTNNSNLATIGDWVDTTTPTNTAVPGSTDIAIVTFGTGLYGTLNVAALDLFQSNNAPTISITGANTSIAATSVAIAGGFTLDMGAELQAAAMNIGGGGTVVTVQNNAVLLDFPGATDTLEIGNTTGNATLDVTAGGQFAYNSSANTLMAIGGVDNSTATMDVSAGGDANADVGSLAIGFYSGDSANLTVTGAGSQFQVNATGTIYIGDYGASDGSGQGTVTVNGGGYLSLEAQEFVEIGTATGGSATITVQGAGSTIQTGNVFLGEYGTNISGTVNVEDGGEFDATDFDVQNGLLYVADFANVATSVFTARNLYVEDGAYADVGADGVMRVADLYQGGTLILTAGTVNARALIENDGKIDGTGTLSAPSILNYGEIDASPGFGALVINGPISSPSGVAFGTTSNTGLLNILDGGTLQLNNTVSSGQTVQFNGATSALILGDVAGFAATISGFAPGDTIDLLGTKATGVTLSATSLTVALSGGGSDTLAQSGLSGDGVQITSSGSDALITDLGTSATLTTGTDIVDFTTGINSVTATAATLQAGDTITGGSGTDTLALSGNFTSPFTFGATTLTNFEAITLAAGNNYDLVLNAATDPSGKSLKIDGSVLDSTKALTLDGHLVAGNLTLLGGAGGDVLTGGAGNDVINGGAGVDTMTGGAGNDTYYVDNVGDKVIEANNGGNDLVYSSVSFSLAGQFIETLTLTGTANINATGNGQANTLNGNAGNNVLDGGAGADTMAGGAGNDTYYVDNVGDHVIEASGAGNDTVYASVSFSLAGQFIETLDLTGTSAINATGNGQANTLVGNSGANILTGGGGADTLTGGAGADTFLYSALSDSTSAAPDLITDFQHGTDKIDLSALHLHAADTYTITSSGGITTIAVFENGDTTADTLIKLTGTNVVTSSDIIWGTAPGAPVARLPVVAAPPTPANDHASPADHHDLVAAFHVITVDHGAFG